MCLLSALGHKEFVTRQCYTNVQAIESEKYRRGWTKLGSLIIRNLPPPVGFSYCDPIGPSGDGRSCGSWNDTKTAKHSRIFMENWMAAFPEWRDLHVMFSKSVIQNNTESGTSHETLIISDTEVWFS